MRGLIRSSLCAAACVLTALNLSACGGSDDAEEDLAEPAVTLEGFVSEADEICARFSREVERMRGELETLTSPREELNWFDELVAMQAAKNDELAALTPPPEAADAWADYIAELKRDEADHNERRVALETQDFETLDRLEERGDRRADAREEALSDLPFTECGQGSTADAEPDKPDGAESATAELGETIEITGEDGTHIRIAAMRVIDPVPATGFGEPDEGNRWIGVEFRVRNLGDEPYNAGASLSYTLITNRGRVADPILGPEGECSGNSLSANLTSRSRIVGCMPFEIPTDAEPEVVQFQPGFGAQEVAEWQLGSARESRE